MRLLFVGSTDLAFPLWQRILRFFFSELAFLPWKAIPFYFLFYFLIPKYFREGRYILMSIYFIGIIVLCLLGYRSLVAPVSEIMYGETPSFNVYSLRRFMYSLTDLIPALGLASTIKLMKGRIASEQKEKALEKEKLESELNFLKAQTNPHFLFNTLNNLYGLARKNDSNTATSIMKLSNIMRYILQECSESSISVESEIKIIEDYIELEKLRYDDRLTVRFKKEVDQYQQEIAPLILLPFVENAFKHGASESRFDSYIYIDLELVNGQLKFRVRNTCDGDNGVVKEGIGLKNIKRQLELIYGNDHDLQIYSEQDAFIIELSIELRPINLN